MTEKKFQRNTRQRQIILEELRRAPSHPTASDLYEAVRKRMNTISLGTVYRNLELLAQNGTIQKLESGGGQARFDGNPTPHYHVRCVHCGALEDTHDVGPDVVDQTVEHVNGFQIIGHSLEFYGICPRCQAAAGEN